MNKTAAALLFGLVILVGCNADGCSHKREVGRVYRSRDGHLYVRSHEKKKKPDLDAFDYWMWIDSDSGSGGRWSRVPSLPSDFAATRLVVREENGKPVDEEGEILNSEDEVIDQNTTEAEAESVDADTGTDAGSDAGDGGGDGGDGGSD